MKKVLFSLVLMLAVTSVAFAGMPVLSGDYIEVRSNHILGGGCTYSSEADYDGNKAVLAWRIANGELSNLSVVAVLLGDGNLDLGQHAREALLFIDANATPSQQQALVEVFTSRYADIFGTVKAVNTAEITFHRSDRDGFEVMVAGEIQVVTRTMVMDDHEYSCDPQIWYAPFISDVSTTLVQTAQHAYTGVQLKSNWSIPNKRSAYVGTFSFASELATR